MTDQPGAARYRRLFARLGEARARDLLDNLQVLALTRPDTVRELEAFIDRTIEAEQSGTRTAIVSANPPPQEPETH